MFLGNFSSSVSANTVGAEQAIVSLVDISLSEQLLLSSQLNSTRNRTCYYPQGMKALQGGEITKLLLANYHDSLVKAFVFLLYLFPTSWSDLTSVRFTRAFLISSDDVTVDVVEFKGSIA